MGAPSGESRTIMNVGRLMRAHLSPTASRHGIPLVAQDARDLEGIEELGMISWQGPARLGTLALPPTRQHG